jgi:hypothetical protein
MSADNKLRCALVYRIDSSVTVIAKYDHASDYEVHAGAVSESLYGDRDNNYVNAVSMVISQNPPGAMSEQGKLGGFKVVQSNVHQVIFGVDADKLCFAVIVGLQYPSRVAIQMLHDLYAEFIPKHGLQAKSATENYLTKKAKPVLQSVCSKYSTPANVDKASSLIGKVDEVKLQMQDNIATMLNNMEKTDVIASQADQLNEQASVFKKKSTQLKSTMRCKNYKMTAMLVILVAVILTVILVPLITRAKKSSSEDNNP